MDYKDYYAIPGEKPLDRIVTDGGFCSIFRTIGFVGDSLSSGEFESVDKDMNVGYHDYFEYSWGQYIARAAGLTAHNFSQGGMTAKGLCTYFNESRDCWNEEEKCQAYVIALGVNDVYVDEGGSGYVLSASSKGYKGTVTVTVGLDNDGKIIGISADVSTETTGIGSKAGDPEYIVDRFVGLSGSADSVDTLSGATYSSKAVKQSVSAILDAFEQIKEMP